MRHRHLLVVAGTLAAVGVGLFAYKAVFHGLPLVPDGQALTWEVEAKISFNGDGGGAAASLYIPRSVAPFALVDYGFISPGYGISTHDDPPNRTATFSINRAEGPQQLYYRFVVHRAAGRGRDAVSDAPQVTRPQWSEVETDAGQALIEGARRQSADTRTFVAQLFRRLFSETPHGPAATLLGTDPSPARRARVASQVLGLAHVAARTVNGVELAQGRHLPYVHWVEVFDGNRWLGFLPEAGAPPTPDNYFPWWRGERNLVRLDGGQDLGVSLAIQPALQRGLQTAYRVSQLRGHQLLSYSLFALPIEIQQVYRVLLVIPIGVLVLVVLRNVIGFTTFGTFMPVLIALAFRETRLVWGVLLFVGVVGLGLAVRLYLESLKLLLVPRLASVLIVVVLAMAAVSVVSYQLGIYQGLSVSLFPMVIMTMTVERMSVIWDERGPAEALKQAVGSLAVAALCYGVMIDATVEHLLFVFPELLLVLLAVIMLLGRYSGYRLLELRRFRSLAAKEDR